MSEPRYLVIGRITRPHGIRGEIRVKLHTDQPDRFNSLKEILIGDETLTLMRVERARFHQGIIILKLTGCDSRNQAEDLRGQWLQIPIEEATPLAEGEYFYYQLIGLQVETAGGELLGELAEILETGANNVFVIRNPRHRTGDLLLPDIPGVVTDIDLEAGRMVAKLPPGLRDE